MRPSRSLLNKMLLPMLCATGAALALSSTSGKASDLPNASESQAVLHASSARSPESPDEMPSPPVSEASPAAGETRNLPSMRFENRLFAMPLPQNLTPSQRQIALDLMREAEPRLSAMHAQLRSTLEELHNLSFASDTPPDALATLGRKLVRLRNDIMLEMRRLSLQMKKKAGFNPGWGTRNCAYPSEESIPPCERLE